MNGSSGCELRGADQPARGADAPVGHPEIFDIAAEMKDCISLGVGEPDFKTPWPIRDAGIRSLERGRTFYTSNSA